MKTSNNQNQLDNTKWQLTEDGIYLILGNGYRISYNPSTLYTFKRHRVKDPLFQYDEDEETEETGLYINETDSYLILNGDFRKDYEICETIGQCRAVFKKYAPQFRSQYCSGIESIF